jgi:predicted alpha/beta-hydrolase family hydrolase
LKSPSKLTVPLDAGGAVTALAYPADRPRAALILGHGAGAGQQSAFMVGFAQAIANLGIDTVTFNFPYTEQRRRAPDRAPMLEACYRSAIETVRAAIPGARPHLFIGGKSMGGRIATQVAAADTTRPIDGLVLLGYPLHPPGRPGARRDAHLPAIKRPMLFVQGSRDAFGSADEMTPIVESLTPPGRLYVVDGGDHSFKIAKVKDQEAVYADIQRTIVEWIDREISRSR